MNCLETYLIAKYMVILSLSLFIVVREIKSKSSCSGFRDKIAKHVSDLVYDLPEHCPDYMPAVSESREIGDGSWNC